MQDWIGLGVFVLLIVGAVAGLKALSKRRTTTAEEFERSAAENTTMLGAMSNALQEIVDPGFARAKVVQAEMKDGRYQKKKDVGDGAKETK
ncbi:MAG: hypothetical protein UZ17_ACD001000527 [Acidobacteria bacterium OLB17]|nr:MAG: hypothetical protein UZ17_ACD001000527 [Acidobacteria bacterium OLB17]MCZ2389601.1 hypothetical protein [Acidobacteriota bacterium]